MKVYIDMDDVITDYSGAYKTALQKEPRIRFPQSQYGFFQKLVPIDNAIESVNHLVNTPDIEPYILTAPSIRNPFSYTEKRVWIETYFGIDFTSRLIICSDKSLLRGDVLVDDNPSGKGQDKFEGKLIIFGSDQFPGWREVINEICIH